MITAIEYAYSEGLEDPEAEDDRLETIFQSLHLNYSSLVMMQTT